MTDADEQYPPWMRDKDEQEPEVEEWHSRISHEDQGEFVFPEPEPEPEPTVAVLDANLASAPAVSQPPPLEVWNERIKKFLENSTNFYATIGVGLGILLGIVAAAVFLHSSGPAVANDLGPVTSSGAGLRGRLFTKWEKTFQYRLTIEPSYQEQVAGFSFAAGNPTRPYSIDIHLQDSQGFVLCSKQIVLRYDPRNPAALAASNPAPAAGNTDADTAPNGQPAPGVDFAQLDAQEAAREKGKDIFQNQIGPNGQIESMSAQGELPCPKESYEKATNWTLTPDFPSVAEQDAMLKHPQATQASTALLASKAAQARKKRTAKVAPNTSQFFVEGDDAIIDFDIAAGTIATRGGRIFSIGVPSAEENALKGHDFPLRIHYRCDQTTACTITSDGAGVLHARLRK